MKRFLALVLVLCLLGGPAGAEEDGEEYLPGKDGTLSVYTAEDRVVTLFRGETPETLTSLAADGKLADWTMAAGVLVEPGQENGTRHFADGLAMLTRGEERMLGILYRREEEPWQFWPLGGEDTFLPGETPLLTYETRGGNLATSCFVLRYDFPGGRTVRFRVMPQFADGGSLGLLVTCAIRACTVSEPERGTLTITLPFFSAVWRYALQQPGGTEPAMQAVEVQYPVFLGAAPLADFPLTVEEAGKVDVIHPAGFPEDCLVAGGVNFRTRTSSRSVSHGELKAGTILRPDAIVPGDPNPWVACRMGPLQGYVVSSYTSLGSDTISASASQPLPVARTLRETPLKNGTGWFDGTVEALPAGTDMHVLMDRGDWLFVCVPRGGAGWFMDVDGTYGFVRRSDTAVAAMTVQLDWTGEPR